MGKRYDCHAVTCSDGEKQGRGRVVSDRAMERERGRELSQGKARDHLGAAELIVAAKMPIVCAAARHHHHMAKFAINWPRLAALGYCSGQLAKDVCWGCWERALARATVADKLLCALALAAIKSQ